MPLYTLAPVEPYPESYQAMVEQAQKEKAINDFPRYQTVPSVFFKERILFVGFPNWWGSYPRIVASFLKDHHFDRRLFFPFVLMKAQDSAIA
ncbi:flavodoxin [Enterococcus casseliflavus]|uniref:flavodoxin n=1 Tax=Enterococcus casseliflavus TaxID=37734 RepID=UPI002DBE794A|nr:flavodoxin [Enterococcus casseliflavus]MEB6145562.1 hypothetical protein [Enterococcus casseliflavus]